MLNDKENTLGIWDREHNHEHYVGVSSWSFSTTYKDTHHWRDPDMTEFTNNIREMHHIKYIRFKLVPHKVNPPSTIMKDMIIAEDTVAQYFLNGRGGVYFSTCDIVKGSRKVVSISQASVLKTWKLISNISIKSKRHGVEMKEIKRLWDNSIETTGQPIRFLHPLAYENPRTDCYSHILVTLLSACPQFILELFNECMCDQCKSKTESTSEIRNNRSWWSQIMRENKFSDVPCVNINAFTKHFGYALNNEQMDFWDYFSTSFEFHNNKSDTSPQFGSFICIGLKKVVENMFSCQTGLVTRCNKCLQVSSKLNEVEAYLQNCLEIDYFDNASNKDIHVTYKAKHVMAIFTYMYSPRESQSEWTCPECKESTKYYEHRIFIKPPSIMFLPMNRTRFDQDTKEYYICQDVVQPPIKLTYELTETLGKDSIYDHAVDKVHYRLFGILLCSNAMLDSDTGVSSSHFYIRIMDWITGKWFEVNDKSVTLLNKGHTLNDSSIGKEVMTMIYVEATYAFNGVYAYLKYIISQGENGETNIG